MTTDFDPFTRWREISDGSGGAAAYQERFDALERDGVDIHGEAALVAALAGPPPARVLDAGCGTGRVAIELDRWGYDCVGVDADLAMLEVARDRAPSVRFVHQDLSTLYLRAQQFDVTVLAGNVVPLVAPGTLNAMMGRIAAHTRPAGLVVAGFGLDPEHLPDGCPVTPLASYELACDLAGLARTHRWSTWGREPWSASAGYVVVVHQRTA